MIAELDSVAFDDMSEAELESLIEQVDKEAAASAREERCKCINCDQEFRQSVIEYFMRELQKGCEFNAERVERLVNGLADAGLGICDRPTKEQLRTRKQLDGNRFQVRIRAVELLSQKRTALVDHVLGTIAADLPDGLRIHAELPRTPGGGFWWFIEDGQLKGCEPEPVPF